MNVSTRVLKSLSGRRKQSIDPAKHFAVRIRNGYADPISREQFLEAVHRVGGTAKLLKQLAIAGMRQTSAQREAGVSDRNLIQALGLKLADAQKVQSNFEAFVRELIFSDQQAFSLVEQARGAMAEAIEAIRLVLDTIDPTPDSNRA